MLKSPENLGIIHFIGIGGIGMSGIAEILHQSGYYIQGSDINESNNTNRLEKLGIKVYEVNYKRHFSVIYDIFTILSLCKIFFLYRFDIIQTITVKPNIYGTIGIILIIIGVFLVNYLGRINS